MLLTYQQALSIVVDAGRMAPAPTESVALADALHRILAKPAIAKVDNPAFDNSAMDGFALRAADLPMPGILPLAGMTAAGDAAATLPFGSCREIMTGAPIPDGANAIIPIEQTQTDAGQVTFAVAATSGAYIRRRGSDLAAGAVVLPAQTRIDISHFLPLAAAGCATLDVYRQVKVAVLSTGPELVSDLSQQLRAGQIYNASGLFAARFLSAAGADVVHAETLPDEETALAAGLNRARAAGADMIITTGAVSAGRFDLVPGVLKAAGADVQFHKLALRPGKPQLFARFPDGAVAFGLPGNPVSTAVGLRFLVWPHLAARMGLTPAAPRLMPLAAAQNGHDELTLLLKARTAENAVHILPGQDSYRVAPLAEMNAWVYIEPGARHEAGALVPVYLLDPLP